MSSHLPSRTIFSGQRSKKFTVDPTVVLKNLPSVMPSLILTHNSSPSKFHADSWGGNCSLFLIHLCLDSSEKASVQRSSCVLPQSLMKWNERGEKTWFIQRAKPQVLNLIPILVLVFFWKQPEFLTWSQTQFFTVKMNPVPKSVFICQQ